MFAPLVENEFLDARENPLSTFAFDVDTASWPVVRRILSEGRLPPPSAVRIEEMINYFPYDYAPPSGNDAFAAHVETMPCPWQPRNTLLKIGVKGKVFSDGARPACNLTFLVDVSGSMSPADRLPLVIQGLNRLVEQLDGRDRVSLVTYASGTHGVLDAVSGADRQTILNALSSLRAGGGTYGEGGLQLAYKLARQNFIPGAANRVILCTDGDFNIGITDDTLLGEFLEKESRDGIFLTALGFGMGNLKNQKLEWLAKKGHGFHSYVDSLAEARRIFGEQAQGALINIAKDVKVQIEFNPTKVGQYRLIGYERRLLAKEDFNDDAKDGGDIGAGHTVTALYELTPLGIRIGRSLPVDALKYQTPSAPSGNSAELLTIKIRHKTPEGNQSKLAEYPVMETDAAPSADFRFAAGVAAFGMTLRDSPHRGGATADMVLSLLAPGLENDPSGVRKEFRDAVLAARRLVAF